MSEHLLPRVRAVAPVERASASTGIDGVSLGGRLSLLVALAAPATFGAVGVTQGAFDTDEVAVLTQRLVPALRQGGLRLRLLTTDGAHVWCSHPLARWTAILGQPSERWRHAGTQARPGGGSRPCQSTTMARAGPCSRA